MNTNCYSRQAQSTSMKMYLGGFIMWLWLSIIKVVQAIKAVFTSKKTINDFWSYDVEAAILPLFECSSVQVKPCEPEVAAQVHQTPLCHTEAEVFHVSLRQPSQVVPVNYFTNPINFLHIRHIRAVYKAVYNKNGVKFKSSSSLVLNLLNTSPLNRGHGQ